MTNHSPLAIYLADHCAGASAGVALARRLAAREASGPYGLALARIAEQVGEDRATLERLVAELGLHPSRAKNAVAWLLERLGRLKPNGRLRGAGGYDRLVGLETLALGITGKLALWDALAVAEVAEASTADLRALAQRARAQRDEIESARLAIAGELLQPSP